jgi:hypothetical protein
MPVSEDTKQQTATYVYGILPADIEADPEARGVGGKPISVVRQGDLAALVSEVATDQALGKPEDLEAHAHLLDAAAAQAPVLPLRFGAVLRSPEAVADELLAANHDQFVAALRELEGRAQYVIRGRYDEKAILSEVLAENEQAAQLREQLRGKPEDATRNERIMLGELVNNAIAAKREVDTRDVVEMLDSLGFTVNVREPTHEEDAVHVAFLAETAQQAELEEAIGELADGWEGRVNLRLIGPLAPYDFVVTQQPQG